MKNYQEKMLKLQKELLEIEKDRMKGNQGYSIKEVVQMMDNAINEKVDAVFINREVSERKEQLLDLRVSVLEAEEERLNGECTINISEARKVLVNRRNILRIDNNQ